MTVSSTIRKAGPYTGTGAVSQYPFSFRVFQAADLLVTKADLNQVEQQLVLASDYTVQLNANQTSHPGGTITLAAGALPSGHRLTITSDIPATQEIDLTNQGGFYPDVINSAHDKLTVLIQQLEEEVSRAVLVDITSPDHPKDLIADLHQQVANAAASATSASSSAGSASASASAAAANASNAATSASNAATSANDAATIATTVASTVAQNVVAATSVGKTSATGSGVLPSGTTAQRDGSPVAGYIRFNTSLTTFEGYNGATWTGVGGGATGGGSDAVFVVNSQTITTNYSIPSGKSASSTGPITINSGITVIVPTGSKWVVL